MAAAEPNGQRVSLEAALESLEVLGGVRVAAYRPCLPIHSTALPMIFSGIGSR